MKTFKIITLIAAIGLFFFSCNKEGQYSPKNKIDKIYYSETRIHEEFDGNTWVTMHTDSTYRLKEDWEWDGAKLKSISYYNSLGDLNTVENYIYDGKRLSSIKWSDDFYCSFHYKHGKIDSINYYYGPYLMESYVVTHTSGKISQITLNECYGSKGMTSPYAMNVFRFLIPNANMESLNKMMSDMRNKMDTKGEASFTMQFEWSGHNIQKMTYIYDSHNSDVFELEYDNKRNPYYGLIDMEEFGEKPFLSKNNITLERSGNNNQTVFTYTYDGDYPVTQSYSYTEGYGDSRNLYTTTLFFEYK